MASDVVIEGCFFDECEEVRGIHEGYSMDTTDNHPKFASSCILWQTREEWKKEKSRAKGENVRKEALS